MQTSLALSRAACPLTWPILPPLLVVSPSSLSHSLAHSLTHSLNSLLCFFVPLPPCLYLPPSLPLLPLHRLLEIFLSFCPHPPTPTLPHPLPDVKCTRAHRRGSKAVRRPGVEGVQGSAGGGPRKCGRGPEFQVVRMVCTQEGVAQEGVTQEGITGGVCKQERVTGRVCAQEEDTGCAETCQWSFRWWRPTWPSRSLRAV